MILHQTHSDKDYYARQSFSEYSEKEYIGVVRISASPAASIQRTKIKNTDLCFDLTEPNMN